ncbi:MAG TPA: PadR family transcriptional regulator [Anaerolineales bacterium]|nr:PadR family transcriptional regulator [Anaerolineales bacterium]
MSILTQRRSIGYSPEFALLGFLKQAPTHGYELHQKLKDHLGEIFHANLSQTYNILTRLEEQAFINGTTQTQEKRPAKRLYILTNSGAERFEKWLTETAPGSVHAVRVELLTRVFFLQKFAPTRIQPTILNQQLAIQSVLEQLQARLNCLPADEIINRAGINLRIEQLSGLLNFLERFLQQSGDSHVN